MLFICNLFLYFYLLLLSSFIYKVKVLVLSKYVVHTTVNGAKAPKLYGV